MKYIPLLLLLLVIVTCNPQTETPDGLSTELSKNIALANEALKASDPAKGLVATSNILHTCL